MKLTASLISTAIIGRFILPACTLLVLCWLLIDLLATNLALPLWLQVTWWLTLLLIALRNKCNTGNSVPLLLVCLFSVFAITAFTQIYFDELLLHSSAHKLANHLAKATVLICALMVTSVTSQIVSPLIKPYLSEREAHLLNKAELILIVSALVATSGFIFGYFYSLPLSPGVLMITVGWMHIIRVIYWVQFFHEHKPNLTANHIINCAFLLLKLTYFLMAMCLCLLGISYFNAVISFDFALNMMVISLLLQTGLAIFISYYRGSVKPVKPVKPVNKHKLIVTWAVLIPLTNPNSPLSNSGIQGLEGMHTKSLQIKSITNHLTHY